MTEVRTRQESECATYAVFYWTDVKASLGCNLAGKEIGRVQAHDQEEALKEAKRQRLGGRRELFVVEVAG